MLSVAPVFDHRVINMKTRIGLSAFLAMLIGMNIEQPPEISDAQAIAVLLQQIAVGLALGFSIKIVFAAFEMAGDFVGYQMGFAFAQFIDPNRGTSSPLLGGFLSILASLIFLSIDGHLMIISTLIKSFEVVPISANLDVIRPGSIAGAGVVMFNLALKLAMPVLATLLILNVVLGILTRASPQMNLMSIGFSITILGGLWLMLVTMPYFASSFEEAINRMLTVSVLKSG